MHKSRRFSAELDGVFHALADPVRRAILAELTTGTKAATKLAQGFAISQPAISRHLRVLREAGLIRTHVKGRNHWCVLHGEGMRDAAAWVEGYRVFWEGQLDALEAFVLEGRQGGTPSGAAPSPNDGARSARAAGRRKKRSQA